MTTNTSSTHWSVLQYREVLQSSTVDVATFYKAHTAYTQEADQVLEAFASLDAQVIQEQCLILQRQKDLGQPLGALFGVPIAVKDIVGTKDFPTACGTPLYAGQYIDQDATIVSRLRQHGALIYGKTVTTEFATFHPGPTRNPHDLDRTPGGSSSGSAAAVAAGLVCAALGSQTNGSVIRPASFCGVFGFKPSRGELPRTGVWEQSPSLDQMGLFAQSIEELALIGEIMTGDDGQDTACRGHALRQWHGVATSAPPKAPKFAFMRTPWWSQVAPDAQRACEAFVKDLSGTIDWIEMPAGFERVVQWHETVNEAELACALHFEYQHHKEALSSALQQRLDKAQLITAADYLFAKSRMAYVTQAFEDVFAQYDAILTPAALGSAPIGLGSTGDPIMQTLWTFGGFPAVNLPLLTLSGGLPMGIQAVGPYLCDGHLLRSCRWLVNTFVERRTA